jgi:hypothetical protein
LHFELFLAERAAAAYAKLKSDPAAKKHYLAVKKSLDFLAVNPRHNSLQTHEFTSLQGPHGEKVFEAYAEQHTPEAYRLFWHYGPAQGAITIIAITPHP